MSAHFDLKNDANGKYMFNLKAGNGEIILTSALFANRDAATAAIEVARTAVTLDTNFERKVATNKKPYFVLKAATGEILGRSEMYSSSSSMEGGVDSVKRNAPTATLKDTTSPEMAEPRMHAPK